MAPFVLPPYLPCSTSVKLGFLQHDVFPAGFSDLVSLPLLFCLVGIFSINLHAIFWWFALSVLGQLLFRVVKTSLGLRDLNPQGCHLISDFWAGFFLCAVFVSESIVRILIFVKFLLFALDEFFILFDYLRVRLQPVGVRGEGQAGSGLVLGAACTVVATLPLFITLGS